MAFDPPLWYAGLVHMGLRMATPWQHPGTGSYYIRERVPADLATKTKGRVVSLDACGRSYRVKLNGWFKASLGTKDQQTAKERFRDASAAV